MHASTCATIHVHQYSSKPAHRLKLQRRRSNPDPPCLFLAVISTLHLRHFFILMQQSSHTKQWLHGSNTTVAGRLQQTSQSPESSSSNAGGSLVLLPAALRQSRTWTAVNIYPEWFPRQYHVGKLGVYITGCLLVLRSQLELNCCNEVVCASTSSYQNSEGCRIMHASISLYQNSEGHKLCVLAHHYIKTVKAVELCILPHYIKIVKDAELCRATYP